MSETVVAKTRVQQQAAGITVWIFKGNTVESVCLLLNLKITETGNICTHLCGWCISGSSKKLFQVLLLQINISNILLIVYCISHTECRRTIYSVCENALRTVMLVKFDRYVGGSGIQVVVLLRKIRKSPSSTTVKSLQTEWLRLLERFKFIDCLLFRKREPVR